MALMWAVLVNDPENEEAMRLLHDELGDKPDTFTKDGVTYIIYSKHTCIIDATTDAHVMRQLGWKRVLVRPI